MLKMATSYLTKTPADSLANSGILFSRRNPIPGSHWLWLCFFCFLAGTSLADSKAAKPKLTVAVYQSFTGLYGPGSDLKSSFEKSCECLVEWVTSTDAAALYVDLKLGKFKKVDIVLGFDNFMVDQMAATRKLESYKAEASYAKEVKSFESPYQPIDFGHFAVIVDTQKVTRFPETFASFLLDSQFKKQFAAQDPRTSTPGFGLLAWIRAISTNEKMYQEKLLELKAQVLSFSKGWNDSYGLFTKGEAKAVFSYVTSELYHRLVESSDRYRALVFKEGNPLQIEYVAILAGSKQTELSKKFLNFLASDEAQKTIAMKNWMFPATQSSMNLLPNRFKDLLTTASTLPMEKELFTAKSRESLIKQWKKTFR